MKISIAMIVKNEEGMLGRALESAKNADEIVVCDTGSEDKTIEIANKYTDKVYTDFVWCDHFGKARQHSKDKCTGDWIITLDADEILETPFEHVREVITKADAEGYVFVNVAVTAETGTAHNAFPRIYKNIPEITWHGPAHNYLNYKGESVGRTFESDIIIKYGYSPAHKKDPDRTLRILKAAVEENTELTRERYYLAREYFYRQNWEQCILHLDEYVKRAGFIKERNDAWLMRAYCLDKLKKYHEAVDSAWQAIKYNANFKEALQFVANHMDPKNKAVWNKFAEIADNSDVLFIRNMNDAN